MKFKQFFLINQCANYKYELNEMKMNLIDQITFDKYLFVDLCLLVNQISSSLKQLQKRKSIIVVV